MDGSHEMMMRRMASGHVFEEMLGNQAIQEHGSRPLPLCFLNRFMRRAGNEDMHGVRPEVG